MREASKTGKPVGGQPKYLTPEAMSEGVEAYFGTVGVFPIKDPEGNVLTDGKGQPMLREVPPTVTGLALHLGFADRQSMYDYRRHPEFSGVLKNAMTRIEEWHERALSVRDKCTGNIFFLKNHDWHDSRELSVRAPVDADRLRKAFMSGMRKGK